MSTCVVTPCLQRELLQELNIERDAAEERRVLLGPQQLGVDVLVGFQQLLVLIAATKMNNY